MAKRERDKLIVNVAKLYYEQNYNQEMISEKLGISRPYISRLLAEAKDSGIVRFVVIDTVNAETDLEKQLHELTNLEKVTAIPRSKDISRLSLVGTAAARRLGELVHNGDTLGYSWGDTMYTTSTKLEETTNIDALTVVQLCGGISNLSHNIYSTEIARNFSSAWGAKPYAPTCPAIVDNINVKNAFMKDRGIASIMELGSKANIAIFTMGVFGVQSALYRTGYVDANLLQELKRKGAVGDICTHVINIHGEIVDEELDSRTIAVSLENIRKKRFRIGVAEGRSKVDSICGAINGGIITELITDEETAEFVLERLKQKR